MTADAQATGVPDRDLPDDQVKGTMDSARELPANLTEAEERRAKLTKLARCTVRPGLMRLPVDDVTTADNSQQYVITFDHPFVDAERTRSYYPIPTDGWTRDKELPRLLAWYGYNTRNVHVMKQERVYVDTTAEEPRDWEIVQPPSEWTKTKRRFAKVIQHRIPPLALRIGHEIRGRFRWALPRGSYASMMALVVVGALLGVLLGLHNVGLSFMDLAGVAALSVVLSSAGFIAGLILVAPPRGDR